MSRSRSLVGEYGPAPRIVLVAGAGRRNSLGVAQSCASSMRSEWALRVSVPWLLDPSLSCRCRPLVRSFAHGIMEGTHLRPPPVPGQ